MRSKEATDNNARNSMKRNQAPVEWEAVFQAVEHPAVILDTHHTVLAANSASIRLTGRPHDEIIGKQCYEIFHGQGVYAPPDVCPMDKMLASGSLEPTAMQMEMLGRLFHVTCTPILDKQGNLDKIVHIATDITKLKQTEDELHLQSEIVNRMDEGVSLIRADDQTIVYANPKFQQMLGYSHSELLGKNISAINAPTERRAEEVAEEIIETLKKKNQCSGEVLNIRKDGSTFWSFANVSRFYHAMQGDVYLTVQTDITERKQAEAALLEAQQFSTDLIRYSATATFVLDRSHRIMLWNKACEELTGRRESEMIGTDDQWKPFYGSKRPTAADVIIDNDLGRLPALYKNYSQSALNPRGIKVEGWYQNLGGKDRYLVFEASPIYSNTGELIAAIETLQDFTESKRLEEQLLQAHKMEAIGVLAGGVAHDFNNILSAIVGYSHLTLSKMPANDPLAGNLKAILQASERATTLTQSLLSFSRKQVINPKPTGLNDIVLRFEMFLTRLIREDVKIITTCTGGDLTIFADRGQIEQLLMNLVTNARDAMPMGGTIIIHTRSVHIDKHFIEERGYGKMGRYALLMVSDAGEGMDSETKRKMFEPFFSTKEPGKGTGLGLSTVYGIVKQNNGYIDVNSEPGKGSTFEIYLPLLEGVAAKERTEAEDVLATGGSETILIAEDNENVRALFSTILQHHGYRVIKAVDGDDAIIKFRENKDQVRLALLDGIMPGKNGKEVYEDIRAINPSLKAIFVSGYAEDIISKEGLLEQGVNFIQKPVTPLALLKKVREVLDA